MQIMSFLLSAKNDFLTFCHNVLKIRRVHMIIYSKIVLKEKVADDVWLEMTFRPEIVFQPDMAIWQKNGNESGLN